MSLLDRIASAKQALRGMEEALEEARREFRSANFRRRNDKRFEGEKLIHWIKRRRRNKRRARRKAEVEELLQRKVEFQRKVLNALIEKREEYQEAKAEGRAGTYHRGSTAIVYLDGKPCVEDLAYWLDRVRREGRWHGVLVSGYRTPEYSESLCYGMCGAPSCPGRCAGRASNHAKTTYPGPAADVSDYYNCEKALIEVGSGYSNNLPIDPVHMSRSGS